MSLNSVSASAVGETLEESDARALRRRPVGVPLLTSYGLGAIVDTGTNVFIGTFLYFYLTAVCGLSGTLAGGMLGFVLIVDSLIEPLIGSISDNSRSRFGRRHPFMLFSSLPIAICLGLLFSVPPALTGATLLAYVFVLTMGLRIGLSAFIVPHIALGAELSDDYHERSTIVAVRLGIGTIGALLITPLGYGVFLSAEAGGLLNRGGYAPFAWSGAAVVLAAALICTFGTASARGRLHQGAKGTGSTLFRLFKEMGEVFRNPSFSFMFAAALVYAIGAGAGGALALHAKTFFWKLSPSAILMIQLAVVPGLFVGITIGALITRWLEKRTLVIGGLLLVAMSQFTPVALSLGGALPGAAASLAVLIGASFLTGLGSGMALVGFHSMTADAADEHELRFGARREGLYFAGLSFANKASSGLGIVIAGMAADAIHFPNNLAALGPDTTIPSSIVRNLGLIYGPGASAITVLGILLVFGFRLNRAAHARVLEALAARRAG